MNQIHTLLCGMLIGATALSGSALAGSNAPAPLGETVTTRFGELQFTQPFRGRISDEGHGGEAV